MVRLQTPTGRLPHCKPANTSKQTDFNLGLKRRKSLVLYSTEDLLWIKTDLC